MQCPHCEGQELEPMIEHGGIELDRCPSCDGLWFDGGELQQVLDVPVRELELSPEANKGERICPRCNIEMYVFQYPTTHVTVDMCAKCHGLWLDGGELMEIAVSRKASGEACPRYAYRAGRIWSYLVEKVQRKESEKELRQYLIDNLRLQADRDKYLEIEQTQLAVERTSETIRTIRIDKKGRFYDHEGTRGFVGAAGVGENVVSVSHIYDSYYFPWLPDKKLEGDSQWDVNFKAGSIPELEEESVFEMRSHFAVVDISRHRGRRSAEIRFTYEGERSDSQSNLKLDGRGTWIFDLENSVDLLLEKRTTSTVTGGPTKEGTTDHTVRRMLCEHPIGFLSTSH
ncbi:MAG: zf-TFIIB domain-containing protein [Candidatus Brocadiia bacterium]